jgi:hypothetical protein
MCAGECVTMGSQVHRKRKKGDCGRDKDDTHRCEFVNDYLGRKLLCSLIFLQC